MVQFFFLLFVSLATSTTGAISGIGGGIILRPVLDAISTFQIREISFLSGTTVLAMSAVSLLRSSGGGVKLETRRGSALALGAAAGGLSGNRLFGLAIQHFDNPAVLGALQSLIIGLTTTGVLLYVLHKKRIRTRNLQNLPLSAALGLALGMISAFLGIGGGPINIAVISWFFSMDSKTAALHSLYTIFISQGASFVLTILSTTAPVIKPAPLIALIAGGVAGGLAGSALSRRMKNIHVDRLFCVILMLVVLLAVRNCAAYFGA